MKFWSTVMPQSKNELLLKDVIMEKAIEKIYPSNEPNILYSLEYLSKEAMRDGHEKLHLILETALNIASHDKTNPVVNGATGEDDSEKILHFLNLFFSSPPKNRRRLLEIIEKFELHQGGKNTGSLLKEVD